MEIARRQHLHLRVHTLLALSLSVLGVNEHFHLWRFLGFHPQLSGAGCGSQPQESHPPPRSGSAAVGNLHKFSLIL